MKEFYHVALSRLLALAMIAMIVIPSQAQVVDNAGKDFYMSYIPNLAGSGYTTELHLTGDVATNVTINYPVNAPTFNTTVAVAPGTVTIVTIPLTSATGWTPGTVQNNAVRAFSTDEFVAYMVNRRDATTDAALVLPLDALNTNYIVQTYEPRFVGSEFAITAAFDNTTVEITPSNAMLGGYAAGVLFSITLNKGEAFLGQSVGSSGPTNDLSGTIVEADKPVALTNGDGCTQVPPGTTACDIVFEIAQPVQTWGMSALVAPLPNRPSGSIYRIMASEDNTTVTQNGAFLATLNRAQFFETAVIPGAHVFAGDKPIFVTQYMTGISFSGAVLGDPAMGNMIPSEQYLQGYTFSTVGGSQFSQNFVSIIAEDTDVAGGTILLDGAPVPAADFTSIPGTGFSYAVKALTEGTHTTSSSGFHGITVEGYDQADSYIYPGGAKFQFINPQGDANPPICDITIDGNAAMGSATDNRPSEDVNDNGILDPGEDLNGNGQIDEDTGIFFIDLLAGSTNLSLSVDPFTPGDGVVTYSVGLVDSNQPGSGTVQATDGAGNTCQVPVELGGAPPVDTTPPVCELISTDPGPPITSTVQMFDGGSGLQSIDVLLANNVTVTIPAFTPGTNDPVSTTSEVIDQVSAWAVQFSVSDVEGNTTQCGFEGAGQACDPEDDPYWDGTVTVIGGMRYLKLVAPRGWQEIEFYNTGNLSVDGLFAPDGTTDLVGGGEFSRAGDTFSYVSGGPFTEVLVKVSALGAGTSTFFIKLHDLGPDCPVIDVDPVIALATDLGETPVAFALGQNYPNPFNPTTTISYTLSESARVSLTVVDLLGREVRRLEEGSKPAGEYAVTFDAAGLPSGIYLYRLEAGTFSQTRRMTLLK